MRFAPRCLAAALSPVLLWSAGAHAHVGTQAVAVVAGALHPWLTPACALILAALVLWQCQIAASTDLAPFGWFAASLAAGVALGLLTPVNPTPSLADLLAVSLALCVTLAWRPPRALWYSTHVAAAMFAGIVAGADAAGEVESPTLFVAGVFAGGLVVPLTVALALVERSSPVAKIGMRVAGSWLAAIALIAMALRFAALRG